MNINVLLISVQTQSHCLYHQVERYLIQLTLDKGIKPLSGSAGIPEQFQAKVLVPDATTYFKVSSAATSIVRNTQDRPEQILNIETSLGVTQLQLLNKSITCLCIAKRLSSNSTRSIHTKPNYQWQDPGEVTPAILALSQPLTLESIPADRDYATLHSYKYHAQYTCLSLREN